MKKQLTLLVLALTLTACGGGSETEINNGTGTTPPPVTPPSPPPTPVVVTKDVNVLASYNNSLLICSDANADGLCSTEEEIGKTDADGFIKVANEKLAHPLLAVLPTDVWYVEPITGEQSYITKFTLSAPAGSQLISPFTTLLQQTSQTVEMVGQAWNYNAADLMGDYEAQLAAGGTVVPYVNRAVNRFLWKQIQQGRTLEAFTLLFIPALQQITEAIANNVDLSELQFAYAPGGMITNNLASELIQLIDGNVLNEAWSFYYVANTGYSATNYSTFGTATFSGLDFCKKTVDLYGTKALSTVVIPVCRSFSIKDNAVQIGFGSDYDVLSLVIGEQSENGVTLVFQVKDSRGAVKGHYWFDNYIQPTDVGVSFSESQWYQSAYYKNGIEFNTDASPKGQSVYTFQAYIGGEYVLTKNAVETSKSYVFTDSHSFQSGFTVGGKVVRYSSDSGSNRFSMVVRQSKRLSLGIDVNPTVEFSLITDNAVLHQKLNAGSLYTE